MLNCLQIDIQIGKWSQTDNINIHTYTLTHTLQQEDVGKDIRKMAGRNSYVVRFYGITESTLAHNGSKREFCRYEERVTLYDHVIRSLSALVHVVIVMNTFLYSLMRNFLRSLK
jgi:hypothetical protein